MKKRNLLIAAGVAGAAGAAAWALHRATHPHEAREPGGPSGQMRPPVPDHLLDLPEGVEEHEIATDDGGTIRYLEAGRGRPLVLVHGWTLRSDVWAPQFHQLTDRFRIISVDLRGHGGSKPGTDGWGLHRLATDLASLLETLDLHDAIVAGHSMGGMTLMTLCRDHPQTVRERIAGLVFIATRASHVVPGPLAGPLRDLLDRGRRIADAGGALPGGGDSGRIARLAFGRRPNPRAVRIVAEMVDSTDPVAMLASADQMFDHDTRADLGAVPVPSMVLVGTHDLLTPVPSARALSALLPDDDFVLFRGAGHQLMQERPDELASLLREFDDRLGRDADAVEDPTETDRS